jgi:hypothetical protein
MAMPALMADVNVERHVRILIAALEGPSWRDLWATLAVPIVTFAERGLARTTPDSALWAICQRDELVLLTANRNASGPDSLEATIRLANTSTSLPVITLADPERVLLDRYYAERAADRLFEILLELDDYRGTGRLYMP